MKIYGLIISLLTITMSASQAEFRIWEDAKGNILEGEFITMNGELAVIRDRSGKDLEFNPTILSESDQLYLEKVVPPTLSIDVSKTTGSGSKNNHGEEVRCFVSIKQASTRPYTGELTAVLVVMGESVRTGKKSSVGKIEHIFKLPTTRGASVEFHSDSERFNGAKSKNKYSGYLIVVWDRFGNPVSIKSNRAEFEKKAKTLASPRSGVGNK